MSDIAVSDAGPFQAYFGCGSQPGTLWAHPGLVEKKGEPNSPTLLEVGHAKSNPSISITC